MFKVPEWGDDVPKINAKFQKTDLKKKEKKQKVPEAQESPVKVNTNGISKNLSAKKSTDKRQLKKRRQKNRELYEKLSNSQITASEINPSNNQPGRFVLNPNKLEPPENKRGKKIKPRKPQKQKIRKQKTNIPNGTNIAIKKPNKRKLDPPKKDSETDNTDLNNIDMCEADELIINSKKMKLDEAFKNEDREEVLFSEKPRLNHKKELLKKVLEQQNGNRNSVKVNGNSLRERMLAKLQAAQFRYLNEKLYTSSGTEAKELFQADPAAFETYHQGYQQQIKKWPVNPLDVIVKRIMKLPKTATIADMGCGSAALAKRVPHKIRSFDLVASAPGVEVCDMAHTPLLSGSMDAVVYCLALMGTELATYLAEGNRVLKTGGHLLIAEVESRFDSVDDFTRGVERLGFKLIKADQSHQVFHFLEFKKIQEAPKKAKHLVLTLKPCLYKRR